MLTHTMFAWRENFAFIFFSFEAFLFVANSNYRFPPLPFFLSPSLVPGSPREFLCSNCVISHCTNKQTPKYRLGEIVKYNINFVFPIQPQSILSILQAKLTLRPLCNRATVIALTRKHSQQNKGRARCSTQNKIFSTAKGRVTHRCRWP